MKKYREMIHPLTEEPAWLIEYAVGGADIIEKYIQTYYEPDFKIAFMDGLTHRTVEVLNTVEDLGTEIQDMVHEALFREGSHLSFIYKSRERKCYMVGIEMINGYFMKVGSSIWKDKKFNRVDKICNKE